MAASVVSQNQQEVGKHGDCSTFCLDKIDRNLSYMLGDDVQTFHEVCDFCVTNNYTPNLFKIVPQINSLNRI